MKKALLLCLAGAFAIPAFAKTVTTPIKLFAPIPIMVSSENTVYNYENNTGHEYIVQVSLNNIQPIDPTKAVPAGVEVDVQCGSEKPMQYLVAPSSITCHLWGYDQLHVYYNDKSTNAIVNGTLQANRVWIK